MVDIKKLTADIETEEFVKTMLTLNASLLFAKIARITGKVGTAHHLILM